MKSNLKRILQKITALQDTGDPGYPDDSGGTIDIPALRNYPLVNFLGTWIAEKVRGNIISHNIQGMVGTDATWIVPDLDAPDDITEYYAWIQNQSVCWKRPGEGDMPEAVFGHYGVAVWAYTMGLLTTGEIGAGRTPRNEVPVLLPVGVDSFPESLANRIDLDGTNLTSGSLAGKSALEIRMAICGAQFNGPESTWKNRRAMLLDQIKERLLGWIDENAGTYINQFGIKPERTANGFPLGFGIGLPSSLDSNNTYVEIEGSGLQAVGNACENTIIWGLLATPNIVISAHNTFLEYWKRRTKTLLRFQALLYIRLIRGTEICNDLPTEEIDKCIACGILVKDTKPKPPIEPLGVFGCTDPLTCPEYEFYNPMLLPPAPDVFREHYERERRNP